MRLGVLDVGSNTVHLLVVDAHRGAHPQPMRSEKTQLRLAEHVDAGRLSRAGADALVRAVTRAKAAAAAAGCAELLAFATSALRDAENSAAVLARVAAETGVALQVLPGADEARYTFLAVRRWYGWSAGRLLVLDIGGGSLELAAGHDEDPEVALSPARFKMMEQDKFNHYEVHCTPANTNDCENGKLIELTYIKERINASSRILTDKARTAFFFVVVPEPATLVAVRETLKSPSVV